MQLKNIQLFKQHTLFKIYCFQSEMFRYSSLKNKCVQKKKKKTVNIKLIYSKN